MRNKNSKNKANEENKKEDVKKAALTGTTDQKSAETESVDVEPTVDSEGNALKVDVLNRSYYISMACTIINTLASKKRNMTFTIDGGWGCGKTFALDKIKRKLIDDNDYNFLVVPYNCWQYDYYAEPLTAIVSALLDYEESTEIFPRDLKITLMQIALNVGVYLATTFIKKKSGIDLNDFMSSIKDTRKGIGEKRKAVKGFDSLYGFNEALSELREVLKELSENHTLVFAVDELDRCMPEYSIKILERLHHITDGIPNMITIIAVDKKMLENSVRSIFGDCNVDDYLKKYIQFSLHLDEGKQEASLFASKYREFYGKFVPYSNGELKRADAFIEELFRGIDIRSQERIVEKTMIIHELCFDHLTIQADYRVMYTELFFTVLRYYYKAVSLFHEQKTVESLSAVFSGKTDIPHKFSYLNSGFNFTNASVISDGSSGNAIIIDPTDIYMWVFYCWYYIPDADTSRLHISTEYYPEPLVDNLETEAFTFLELFFETMRFIG